MTTMITEVYDAFLDVGVSDEKARRAAVAMAGSEQRFDQIGKRFDEVDGQLDALDRRIDDLENRINRRIDDLENRLDRRIDQVESRLDRRVDELKAELVLHRWMLGFLLAFQVAILLKLFLK